MMHAKIWQPFTVCKPPFLQRLRYRRIITSSRPIFNKPATMRASVTMFFHLEEANAGESADSPFLPFLATFAP